MDISGYLVVSSLSTQTIWLPVSSTNPITGDVDLTAGGVQVGASQLGVGEVGGVPTWINAAWETSTVLIDGTPMHLVRTVIGPTSALALAIGFWTIYIKLLVTNPSSIIQSTSVLVF